MRRLHYLILNIIIFSSTLKESLRFLAGLINYRKVQNNKFRSLSRRNRHTAFLKDIANSYRGIPVNLPLTSWEDYEKYILRIFKNEQNVLTNESVLLLEPTSGTTSPVKYIPYTRSLQKEFNRGIRPWLAGIYLAWPKMFLCTQYWSLSPAIKPVSLSEPLNKEHEEGRQTRGSVVPSPAIPGFESLPAEQEIPVGFEQDSQYLGCGRGKILNKLMSVPAEVRNCGDHESWAYVTAFYLLRDRDLGLISVWHPSFIVILIEKIRHHFMSLVDDIDKGGISDPSGQFNAFISRKPEPSGKRAGELRGLDIENPGVFKLVWPRLQLISCWADNPEDPSLAELKNIFPGTPIQPKGIIATEGIISFPFGKITGIPAVCSHYLEFIDLKDGSLNTIDQLKKDKDYETVITTGGGLYRYRMNDVIRVTGLFHNIPLFRFISKRDYFSDLRGEKISLNHAGEICKMVRKIFPGILFLMIAPVIKGNSAFYTCFVYLKDENDFPFGDMCRYIDENLKENYNYRYAREIGQLDVPAIYLLKDDPVNDMIQYMESTGIKRGDIKLYCLNKLTVWPQYLKGEFIIINRQ